MATEYFDIVAASPLPPRPERGCGAFLLNRARASRGYNGPSLPRPTGLCLWLMAGGDIYQIPKNCRTSVEMLEHYYAAHINTPLDTEAINRRRPRSRGNKKTNGE